MAAGGTRLARRGAWSRRANDPSGNTGHHGAGWDILSDHAIGTNHSIVADGYFANDYRPGADVDSIAQHGHATVSWIATNRNVLRDKTIVTDDGV